MIVPERQRLAAVGYDPADPYATYAAYDEVDPGETGRESVPIVIIGPARVMDRAGHFVSGARAVLKVGDRVVKTEDVPEDIFETFVDKQDFDAGVTIVFEAPRRPPIEMPATRLLCNTGTRNEYGTITSMTKRACPTQDFEFGPATYAGPRPH